MDMRTVARTALVGAAVAMCWSIEAPAQGMIRHGIGAQTLFPLREGNTWTYARRGQAETVEWSVAVTAKVSAPRVHPYFTLEGYFPGAPHSVRSDPFGTVTERSEGFRDNLWYLLGAPEGTSWTLQLAPSPLAGPLTDCIAGAKLTLAARGETISVPAGDFTRVVRVDWATTCADAGFASEWFAPGIGLIRRDELTIAGIVTSELIRAELEGGAWPRIGYTTSLSIDRPLYTNNLMPPVGHGAIPTVAGSLTVHERADVPFALAFVGCKRVALAVVDEAGETVLTAQSDDGGCCECSTPVEWDFSRGPLVVPFTFGLAGNDGQPLPDGRYAIEATLGTVDAASVRPSARATVVITSTH